MRQLLYAITDDITLNEAIIDIKQVVGEKNCRSLLFHLYCGLTDVDFVEDIVKELVECFPEADIAGVTSNAEVYEGKMIEQTIVLSAMLFEKTDITVTFFREISGREHKLGEQIKEQINDVPEIKAAELLMHESNTDTFQFLHELEHCHENIRFFGAYPLGHDIYSDEKYLITRDGLWKEGIIVITYAGKDFHVDVGHTEGWKAIGHSYKVTRARKNLLYEIDGKPASEFYSRYLQIESDKLFLENVTEFPLMATFDGMHMLRHPLGCQEDGTLVLAGSVWPGMEVSLTYGNPSVIIRKVNERCEKLAEFQPEVLLLYSCAVRKIFWKDFLDKEMEPFESLAQTAGFYSGGEIYRGPVTGRFREYNISLLSIGMREGGRRRTEKKAVKIDDMALRGQTSLITRLTKLVETVTEELVASNEKLERMAVTDELTGLYNRREIERRINEALDQAEEQGKVVALVMLDIDHFKQVNDTYGHGTGDAVLRGVSHIIAEQVKHTTGESAGRWGGEEFFLLLPGKGLNEAVAVAERLRQSVEAEDFGDVESLTVSLGVTEVFAGEERKRIFKRVDDALYQAKESGRNRVIIAKY